MTELIRIKKIEFKKSRYISILFTIKIRYREKATHNA